MENSKLHVTGWHAPRNVCRADVSAPFVVHEEKGLVFPDRSADAASKSVVSQRRVFSSCGITVPGVSIQYVILQVLIHSAVPRVAAAARDHLHFAASGAR